MAWGRKVVHVVALSECMATLPELKTAPASGPEALKKRQVRHQWVVPEDLLQNRNAAGIVILDVQGDSMTPDFAPGDRVVVDTADITPSPALYGA